MKALTREIYTPWILFVTLALSVTLVSSCSTIGGKVETPNEAFALSATLLETGYDMVRIAFRDGSLDRDKALELRNSLAEAENAVRLAESAYRQGQAYDQNVFSKIRAVLSTVRSAIAVTVDLSDPSDAT